MEKIINFIKFLLEQKLIYKWVINLAVLLGIFGVIFYFLYPKYASKKENENNLQLIISKRIDVNNMYETFEMCGGNLKITELFLQKIDKKYNVFINDLILQSNVFSACGLHFVELPWVYNHAKEFDIIYILEQQKTIDFIEKIPQNLVQDITIPEIQILVPEIFSMIMTIDKNIKNHNATLPSRLKFIKKTQKNLIIFYVISIPEIKLECEETLLNSLLKGF